MYLYLHICIRIKIKLSTVLAVLNKPYKKTGACIYVHKLEVILLWRLCIGRPMVFKLKELLLKPTYYTLILRFTPKINLLF